MEQEEKGGEGVMQNQGLREHVERGESIPMRIIILGAEASTDKIKFTVGSAGAQLSSERNIVCRNAFGEHVNIRAFLRDGILYGECGACGELMPLRSSWDNKEPARFVKKSDYDTVSGLSVITLIAFAFFRAVLFRFSRKLRTMQDGSYET